MKRKELRRIRVWGGEAAGVQRRSRTSSHRVVMAAWHPGCCNDCGLLTNLMGRWRLANVLERAGRDGKERQQTSQFKRAQKQVKSR